VPEIAAQVAEVSRLRTRWLSNPDFKDRLVHAARVLLSLYEDLEWEQDTRREAEANGLV